MVKYNTTEYVNGHGVKYVFVTRGKSAPFTKEEILSYVAKEEAAVHKAPSVSQQLIDDLIGVEEEKPSIVSWPFVVPKVRENIFLADLKLGLKFCVKKYGALEADVISEAKRVFPSLNLEKLWEKKEKNDGVKGQAK